MIVDLFCVDCGMTTRCSAVLQLDPAGLVGKIEMDKPLGSKTRLEYVELAVLCKACYGNRTAHRKAAEAVSSG